MNIFATDRDTTICASYHTDRHIVKNVNQFLALSVNITI
jgi:hypothetical protein